MGARQSRPVGAITRGTTNPNRLRRVDRWLAGTQAWRLRRAVDPLVVDLGYGATPVTVLELHARLRRVRSDVEVLGVEIDPERVRAAQGFTGAGVRAGVGVGFALGGFDLAVLGARRAVVVRAFNVLRQYPEPDVGPAWALIGSRLAADGLLIDGTCDEIGRLASWVAVDASGPVSLTVSMRLRGLGLPSEVAERLPKALIHRNVPGEAIHAFLQALDRGWERHAAVGSFGVRQRWLATAGSLQAAGWPVLGGPSRWRLGEITIDWTAVAPR